MNTDTRTRAEMIADALALCTASREETNAAQYPVGAFIIVAESGAVMSLTFDDAGSIRFSATNTPRAFAKTVADDHARRWNRQHGVAHPVKVLSAEEWKAARLAEIAASVAYINEAAGE